MVTKPRSIRELLLLNPTPGDLGLEIEVEGSHLPTVLNTQLWRIDHDTSLKGESAEYVTPKPMSYKELGDALDYLHSTFLSNKTKIHDTIRAGVHVHRNVQELTMKQLFTFVTAYFILEDLLVNWCGKNREGNYFCLRVKDAEYILFLLEKTLRSRKLSYLKTDQIRYCSLNLFSLFKYGSLEFRAMRSTHNLDVIYEWAGIIDELYNSSLKFADPKDLITSMSGDGEFQFLKTLLPTYYTKFSLFNYPNRNELIRDAARRVQMLAFTIDWDLFDKPSKNPFINEIEPEPAIFDELQLEPEWDP